METFLNRYRNITVLLLVIFSQLVLLAVQVKNDQDVRMIRVWTVTAVTPVARVIEALRGGSTGFVRDYIVLHDTHEQNVRLQAEVDRLKLENNFLKNELNTADRAKALALFQNRTPSKTLAATVIGTAAGSNSTVVFVDRGSTSGVERGMAVVTPDGIVGKVIAAYPTASQVLLITDPDFAAGVISQKTQVRGTLKGQGTPMCKVDYIPNEEKLQVGDWFYTSGDDRVFPRGLPAGIIKVVRRGQPYQEVLVEPVGKQRGVEDVLILLEGVHQKIPDEPPTNQPVYIAPPVGAPEAEVPAVQTAGTTDADKLRTRYKAVGDAQGHKFGEGLPGSKPPDFNLKLPAANQAPEKQGPGIGGQGPGKPPTAAPAPNTKPPAATTSTPNPRPPAPDAQVPGSRPLAPNSPTPSPRPATPGARVPVQRPQTPPSPLRDDAAPRPHSE